LTNIRLTLILTNRDLLASPYLRTSSTGKPANGRDAKEKLLSDLAIPFMNSASLEPGLTPVCMSVAKMLVSMLSRISLRVSALSEAEVAAYLVSLNLPLSSR